MLWNSVNSQTSDINFEYPLLKFSEDKNDHWTIRNSFEGTQVFGGIGSGKTSGSGRMLAKTFLENGYGGLVLCAKPDEADIWKKYAEDYGRSKDIIIFSEGSEWRFNPLHYEMSRTGKGAGQTINITELFMTVFKMGQRISGSNAEEKERFWENSMKRCINRIIDLIRLAEEDLSIFNMVQILSSAASEEDIEEKIKNTTKDELIKLCEEDFYLRCLYNAGINTDTPQKDRAFGLIYSYFLRDFPKLDQKVKSTIVEMFLGYCEPFLTGILYEHFAQDTNLTPEKSFEGKIIILDFAVKDYLVAGIYAQCIFKFLWQQVVERRNIKIHPRPVFLWADESQYFVNEYDTIFQTTARSSRAATVFLTQNISNYYAQMGGNESHSKVDSLLGNLSTKIFHCNNDAVTNEWASKVIGHDLIALESGSTSKANFSIASNTVGQSYSMQILPQVLPVEFTTLAQGGDFFNFKTQAIVTVKGKKWSDGKNYKKAVFPQQK